MSRGTVGAVFALFTAATGKRLVEMTVEALSGGTGRAWLVAGYWLLKLGVVGAFTYFVIVRPAARRAARSVVAWGACLAAIAAAVALHGPGPRGVTPMLLTGEAVAVTGAAWLLASVLVLGRCFGILPEARGLVTRGPYRLVRHPVYLGELIMCAGLVLAAPGAWNLGCAIALLAAQLVRMRFEERALAAEFPAYISYAASTPRLLPRPWRRPPLGHTTFPTQGMGGLRPPQEA